MFHVYVPNEKEIRLALREAVYNLYDPWRWLKEGGGLEPGEVVQEIRNRMGLLEFTVV